MRQRVADRAKQSDNQAPTLAVQVRKLNGEIANLTTAIATGGAGTPVAMMQAVREREARVAALEAQISALGTTPQVIGLETRRMEKEARARLTEFRSLLQRDNEGARKVLDALLDETPLKFTPTPDNHYVIEGPVYLGRLCRVASDPSGIQRPTTIREDPRGSVVHREKPAAGGSSRGLVRRDCSKCSKQRCWSGLPATW